MTDDLFEIFMSSASERFREFLRERGLSQSVRADIINRSFVPLEIKAEWLDGVDKQETENAIRALYNTASGEIFCLYSARYDRRTYNESGGF